MAAADWGLRYWLIHLHRGQVSNRGAQCVSWSKSCSLSLYFIASKQSIFDTLHLSGPEGSPLTAPVVVEENFDQDQGVWFLSSLRLVNVRLKIEVIKAEERQRYLTAQVSLANTCHTTHGHFHTTHCCQSTICLLPIPLYESQISLRMGHIQVVRCL